jgi:WD40 repeat protein/serine/threonine protein kinase
MATPNDPTIPDDSLDGIIAAYLAAIDAGLSPDRQALLNRYPKHAEQLRSFFADHDRMDRAAAPLRLAETSDSSKESATDGSSALPRIRYFGDYELLQEIARGGMGIVYKARQVSLNRIVAVKMILAGQFASEAEVQRFYAEARAAANLQHPNIVAIHEVGQHENQHYFSMDYIEGKSLAQVVRESPLFAERAASYLKTIAEAIEFAHKQGTLHRDLKPSNVLIDRFDQPQITDFGLAKRIEGTAQITATGPITGTPSYMPPEQAGANEGKVSRASDVYSLGALLYDLLTGRPPFLGENLVVTLNQVLNAEPVAPRLLSPEVPRDLETICLKCLEKDPQKRYPSASALAEDLGHFLRHEPIAARPVSRWERGWRWCKRNPVTASLSASFVFLLLVSAIGGLTLSVIATQNARHANENAKRASEEGQRAAAARMEAELQRDEARLTAYASGMQLAQRAWEENNVVRARELLEEVPKEATGRKLRGFEWYYLHRLCHSEALTLGGHSGQVMSVAFSPDGQRLASASQLNDPFVGLNSAVRIWDCATGKELFSLKVNASLGVLTSVAYSPDGRRLASGDNKTVKIWDSATGKNLLGIDTDLVNSLAFSPDGQRLASGHDFGPEGIVKIWDSSTGKELLHLYTEGPVNSVMFSPDGRRLALGGDDRTVKIWDSTTRKELFALRGHSGAVTSVAFSPDGQRLASASNDHTVKIWDSATGKELLSLKGHADAVRSVAFSPDGQRLASGSGDRTVKIWDSATGEQLFILKGHSDEVRSVAFSPDGERLASASSDQMVKIWDTTVGKEQFDFKAHPGPVGSVAFSPDGRRLTSVNEDDTVKLWDSATGEQLLAWDSREKGVSRYAVFSPDGQRLAAESDGGTVKIWDSATGKELLSLKGHGAPVRVAFSLDGKRLASGGYDRTVKIWDSATGKELLSLKGHGAPVLGVAFSLDGKRLASGSGDRMVKIWDSATGKELFALKGHSDVVSSLAFSPNGKRLASGSWDRTVKIWDSATGKELLSLNGHGAAVMSVAFSPDGQRLVSASDDKTVKIWDSATGKELFTFKDQAVTSVAFSSDGHRLAAGDDGGFIRLWETSVSPGMQHFRAMKRMVTDLFGRLLLRVDVLERLRTLRGTSPSRRQDAITFAQTYPEDRVALNNAARALVKLPGGEMSGYRKALRYSQEACQLAPGNGPALNLVGIAYYRLGNYEQALATLRRAHQMIEAHFRDSSPSNLAFLAMTQKHIGHAEEAQAELERLRVRMEGRHEADAEGFLREAEMLLAKPKTPGDKKSAATKP